MDNSNLAQLVDQAIGEPSVAGPAKDELKKALKLDDLNLEYFLSLYATFKGPRTVEAIELYEPGRPRTGKQIAYPTAVANPDLMKVLPYVTYEELKDPSHDYIQHAREASLWLKKMQAGTGSSLTRTSYLAQILGIPESKVKIGAKGTDLFVEVPGPGGKQARIPLAEVQLLQAIHDAREGVFAEVILHDIVSNETETSLEALWRKPSLVDPSKTYDELAHSLPGFRRSGRSFQTHIPTIDHDGRATLNRVAPGGHALFAVDALRAAYLEGALPQSKGALVSAIGNGEDLSSTPDEAIVGWMVEKNIPVVMVTTEKTENDLKGGQIAVVQRPQGGTYVTIIEQAQAKEAGQLKLFEELGLRKGDGVAFFNTNMALFNYRALAPMIRTLVREIGEQKFMRLISPDLIENKKAQVDRDGASRTYVQLEGAMGSSLLRLDRVWRERYGKPLVHFVNVGRENRTLFFSPIKTAFDYFMQFHSDRFTLDPENMRLVNRRPGMLPAVSLSEKSSGDKYYADVGNILHCFEGCKITDLDQLEVSGKVVFKGMTLRGKVAVHNSSGTEVNLSQHTGKTVLENTKIEL